MMGDVGEFAHGGEYVGLLLLEEDAQLLVVFAGDFGALGIVGHVEARK